MILLNALKWIAIVFIVSIFTVVLYLSFADLDWLKPRVESAVTSATGRQFQLGGAFKLAIVPAPAVLLEDVSLSNVEWGSTPAMATVGHLSARLGLWSLISGPVRIKELRLRDVDVLLETNVQGKGNWSMGEPTEAVPEEETASGPESGRLPIIIEFAEISNISLSYQEPDSEPIVAEVESLGIQTDPATFTRLEGKGVIAELPWMLKGKLGPDRALVTGRGIAIELRAGLEIAELTIDGNLGNLEKATGIDIKAVASSDDLTRILEYFETDLPLTGPLKVETALTSADPGNRIVVDATAGDLAATATLTLVENSLEFEAAVPALDKVGQVLEVEGLPSEDLAVDGRVLLEEEAYGLDKISARLAEAEFQIDGSIGRDSSAGAEVSVTANGPSLASLGAGLPGIPFKADWKTRVTPESLVIDEIDVSFGESDLAGSLDVAMGERTSVAGKFNSKRLDLTPFASGGDESSDGAGAAEVAPSDPGEGETQSRYVFTEDPLSLKQLQEMDVDIDTRIDHFAVNNVILLDVTTSVELQAGELRLENRFRGPEGGRSVTDLVLDAAGEAALADIDVKMRDLRVNLISGDIEDPSLIPPVDITIDLNSKGSTPRALASSANGRILVTQGQGQLENDLIGTIGGGIFKQLFSALNPFAEEETSTTLDCTIVGLDFTDGLGETAGMLFQTQKIKALGDGEIDLNTEELNIEFNTKPREGVGVSATMFVTPFVKLAGTLASPSIGVNAKGTLLAGAAVAATGGLAILAKGAADRTAGGVDRCQELLAEVGGHPPIGDR